MFSGRRQQSLKQFQFSKKSFCFHAARWCQGSTRICESCNQNLFDNKSFEVTIPSQHQKIFAMLLFSPPPRSLHHLLLALHAVLAGSDLKRWLIETERELERGSGTDVGNLLGGASVRLPLLRKYPQRRNPKISLVCIILIGVVFYHPPTVFGSVRLPLLRKYPQKRNPKISSACYLLHHRNSYAWFSLTLCCWVNEVAVVEEVAG